MIDLTKFTKSKGLPGGPNELGFSVEGYKADSPDRFNPFNVINSGNITMNNVPHPVLGIDNQGNAQMMTPGNNYKFPGDQVFELPVVQSGKNIHFGYQPITYNSINNPIYTSKLQDGGSLSGDPSVATTETPIDPYQATMDWLNANPYMYNNKPIYLDDLEMVQSKNYPSMHGKVINIPGAGNYGEDQYQLITMPEGYNGLPVYLVNGKPVVVDEKFNKEYFNMYQQNKLFGKSELFPIYGRGTPYRRPTTNMQDGGYIDMDLTDEEIQGLRHQGYWIEEL